MAFPTLKLQTGFYNGGNDLSFENQPAKSPDYGELLFGKVVLQLREEQNYHAQRP